MRKLYLFVIALILSFAIIGCDVQREDSQSKTEEIDNADSTQLYSVEIISDKWMCNNDSIGSAQISLVRQKACIVHDGKVTVYDGEWKDYESDINIITVYDGELFCALNDSGNIILQSENLNTGEYGGYPLSTSAMFYNAEQVINFTDEKILALSGNLLAGEYCVAYFSDGCTRIFHNGAMLELSDVTDVADISGRFILSTQGEVYKAIYNESFVNADAETISEKNM